ncbi:hypothetical protein [Montanilutibacter psychrotolerans]|uniref:TerB family tellurite resistance protein n=1 Tax=Montanilutibacter psychrotolerans TaxID=1327343 RepID=A0A3M8ST30_9GAMM|nr:hypothetical protein [Lysobacter psychrotolerans]RNF82384.1 hypothetical protein EER27_14640 [Lysobacter psychrotolerans]
MSQPKSHLEIALAAIHVFGNDGLLDVAEFDKLIALASRDETIDEDEKRVLNNIFIQAEQTKIDPSVAARIAQVRAQHGIGA